MVALVLPIGEFGHVYMVSMDALIAISGKDGRMLRDNVSDDVVEGQLLKEAIDPRYGLCLGLARIEHGVKFLLQVR